LDDFRIGLGDIVGFSDVILEVVEFGYG